MYLQKTTQKNGRIFLSIKKTYRDTSTKKNKSTNVSSIGWLDELEKEYDDPIAHFKEVARQMTADERERKSADRYRLRRASA
jgi:predicted RNA-binding protein with RPS1 domain